jgi:hypothetical protein
VVRLSGGLDRVNLCLVILVRLSKHVLKIVNLISSLVLVVNTIDKVSIDSLVDAAV